MEDRFRFRVWNTDTKEMKKCGQICIVPTALCSMMGENLDSIHFVFHPHKKIMQCTGLKDKNGKLIYEGDIITFRNVIGRKEIGEIIYSNKKASFLVKYFNLPEPDTIFISLDLYKLQVIGNIYENPELLESEE